jgi:hypothetical protein
LRERLNAALVPATPEETAKAVRALVGSFKTPDNLPGPETFSKAMTEELSVYPADVLYLAIREARRNLPWMPAISQMVGLCERVMRERRDMVRLVDIRQKGVRGLNDHLFLVRHAAKNAPTEAADVVIRAAKGES